MWWPYVVALSNVKIKHDLNAPLISPFDKIKEEEDKFIVSRYHYGKVWLDGSIEIIESLISHITRLPRKGDLVMKAPKGS